MTSVFQFQTKSLHKHTGKHFSSYLDIDMGHEHSKVGQVCAGTGGVRAVGSEETAVLRRPEARHAALGVAPERAVWVEVLLRLLWARSQIRREEHGPSGHLFFLLSLFGVTSIGKKLIIYYFLFTH